MAAVIETMQISYEMSILLFAAVLGYIIAHRLKQPTAVVNILLGILLGPTALNIIKYDNFVQTFAYLGAIFLIFVAGLEYKGHHIYTKKNILVALGGMLLPWLGGFFFAKIFYGSVESIFIATTLTATSIAVSVGVLDGLGILKNKMTGVIIGAALVDDILGLLALSITRGFVSSGVNVHGFITKTLLSTVFLIIAILAGPYISRAMIKIHDWAKPRKVHHLTYLFAIMIAFLYGTIAELVGLSGIIGAFLAGFALERLNYKDFKIGAQYVEMLFSSIFFMSLGILVKVVISKKIALLVIAITLIAVITKAIGSGLMARLTGIKTRDAIITGIAMVPRGEVAMITALIGLQIGAIGNEVYSILVLMALITCVVTPFMLKYVIPKKAESVT